MFHMANKIIQVPVDESLLKSLDETSRGQNVSRSALIRDACRRYLKALRDREADRLYAEAYGRAPDTGEAGDIQLKILDGVLSEEDWEEGSW